MNDYTLTIDSIISPAILTDVSLLQQPLLIKILILVVVFICIFGLFSNYCSMIVFVHPNIQAYGFGKYFVALTICNQIGIIMFLCRFIYLVVSQIILIENHLFLLTSCAIFDSIVQYPFSVSNWLMTCIACERLMMVIKGFNFNKWESVRVSKVVKRCLFLLLLLTFIPQIFNRQLINNPQIEKRLLCVIQFRYTWLRIYEIIINFFRDIIPFIINIISAILLLKFFSRKKLRARKRIYTESELPLFFSQQFYRHKHLIISPLIMVILKLPMIVVLMILKCFPTEKQMYVALICYILTLLPATVTFFIFIHPSTTYYKIFIEKRNKLFGIPYKKF